MATVVLPQRQGIDYGKLGQVVGQAINPMAGLQKQLIPLLFKAKLDKQMQQEQLKNSLEMLGGVGTRGGQRVKGGTLDMSTGKLSMSFEQPTAEKQVEEKLAQQDLAALGGQGQATQPPVQAPPIQNLIQAASGGGQTQAPTMQQGGVAVSGGLPNIPGLLPSERRKLELEFAQKQIASQATATGKTLVAKTKRQRQLGETVAAFRGIVAQGKGMAEEQGGLGLVPGIKGAYGAKTFRPGSGRAAAFEGQRTETTFRLNSILTGQNRVIRGVVGMIQATLPTRYDPPDMFAAKVAQSVTNAYKLSKAFQSKGYTPEYFKGLESTKSKVMGKEVDVVDIDLSEQDLQNMVGSYDLSQGEKQELEGLIQGILQTPATKARTLPGLKIPKAVKGTNKREQYNRLRAQGVSPSEARKKAGI